ncbi:ABC transporter substrate-binding protein [Bradyrhizobium sp. dw_78]|uniref:ABC transporter substrate-binding protein n=1 Tax=Bradyrhizobium sp. dw_78 TaxID=2719793 RepID=UPI001BD463F6|nr:ABC transporter substrate-binding protein [Bradyrhizobium sp. dw_78]
MIFRATMVRSALLAALIFGATGLFARDAHAEVSELRLARQYGISHLAMALMDQLQLVQHQAEKAGLKDLKVTWSRFSDGPGMNEALLSGNLDIANGGLTALIVLWDKSKGAYVGLSALSSMPAVMMTRDPAITSVKDFKESDRIGLVSRVSMQAIILRMLAAEAYGKDQSARLDHLTVPLPHPDAMAALLSGRSEITAHFTAAPYYQQETAAGLHRAFSSYGILGGPATYSVVWTSKKFIEQNPRTTQVVLAAIEEATDIIKNDPRRAAETYLKAEDSSLSADAVEAMIKDPENVFTMTPQNVMKFVNFMTETGTVKSPANSWKDLFTSLIADKPGS